MALPGLRALGSSALYRRATVGPAFVQARFGTARGLVRLWLSQLDSIRGRFRRFERVEWRRVRRLVFVCAGNICRSPYAEWRAREAGFPTASIGMSGIGGQPADPQALASARLLGLDLGAHVSTNIDEFAPEPGDLLVALEPRQAQALSSRFAADPGVQVTLLGLWSRPRRAHLYDPHTLSPAYFRTCFELIDGAVATLLAKVRSG